MISTVARASLPRALEEAGKEARQAWRHASDTLERHHGIVIDRSKPYCKEEIDAVAAKWKFVAKPGELPVVWRMWLLRREETDGDPTYPCVELRYHDDGYSAHLVTGEGSNAG